jgi:hypothetical protein
MFQVRVHNDRLVLEYLWAIGSKSSYAAFLMTAVEQEHARAATTAEYWAWICQLDSVGGFILTHGHWYLNQCLLEDNLTAST